MKPNANINIMYDMTLFHSHTWHMDRSCWGPIVWPSQHSDLKHGDENHTTLGSQECAICRTFCVFGFIGYVRCQLLPQKKMQHFAKMIKQNLNHHVHTAPCIYPLLEWSHSIYSIPKTGDMQKWPGSTIIYRQIIWTNIEHDKPRSLSNQGLHSCLLYPS